MSRANHTPLSARRGMTARDGHACAWHWVGACDPETLVPQHRQGGMGGRKGKHRLSNVVWLCSLMNGRIEDDAELAKVARGRGIKISLHANPVKEPILHAVHGWCFLGDDGSVKPFRSEGHDGSRRPARVDERTI